MDATPAHTLMMASLTPSVTPPQVTPPCDHSAPPPGLPWVRVYEHPTLPAPGTQHTAPVVVRGGALHWPAVKHWTWAHLAQIAEGLSPVPEVSLVCGNRELHPTHMRHVALPAYLKALDTTAPPAPQEAPEPVMGALKEFDLLRVMPTLQADLQRHTLFAPHHKVASYVWIGPAHARTGLHYDVLDNIAVVLRGRKRFHLAPPGAVEALGEVSDKYDRWATLARIDADTLAARYTTLPPNAQASQRPAPVLRCVDLGPGDVLYLPARWWHEVVNLTPSILLSGFHGPAYQVYLQWLRTAGWQCLHDWGWWRHGHCTCHVTLSASD